MKFKPLLLSMGLVLFVPGFTAAANPVPAEKVQKKPCNCQEEKRDHHMMHKDWQAHMAEKEQMLLSWVNQYTPDKKADWIKVLDEKETLRSQWMSPENAQKRERWKKEKWEKMKELKKQFDEGKITKEEFIKKVHGGKDMGHWKSFHDLRLAVEKKDDKQAVILLNQLLLQYKEHNEKMKEILKK